MNRIRLERKLKRRRSKKRPPLKFAFWQDWGTYDNQSLVCVGLDRDDVLSHAKRLNAKRWFIEWLRDDPEVQEFFNNSQLGGFFGHHRGASILWLKEFRDEWPFYETLMHELHHAVFYLLEGNNGMHAEMEAQAYQQGFLFRQIRRRFQKRLGILA